MRILAVLLMGLVLAGCEAKRESIVVTEYKQVDRAVKCDIPIPQAPFYDKERPETFGEKIKYYELIEKLLKGCVNGSN